MGIAQNFIIGNKTKIFFTPLPDSLIQTPAVPKDAVDITLTAAATVAAANAVSSTLAVVALTEPVPAGVMLEFSSGTGANIVKTQTFTIASAKAGETAVVVEPLQSPIANAAKATYTAMLLLVGGTTSDEQIQAKDQETQIYGDELGYSTGIVTGASWSISYSFNVLPSDPGYYRLSYVALNAVRGIRGWVRKQDPAPAGYANGESIEGLCDVTDFSKSNPADGIITGKLTFKGRGTPVIKHYS